MTIPPSDSAQVPTIATGAADLIRRADRATAWWIAGLLPAGAGLVFFGPSALGVIAGCVSASIAGHFLLALRMAGGRPDVARNAPGGAARAALMGLLLALTLPAGTPWSATMLGGLIAALIGCGSTDQSGCARWHPALVSRVLLQALFGASLGGGPPLLTAPVLTPARILFGSLDGATVVDDAPYPGWAAIPKQPWTDAVRLPRAEPLIRNAVRGVDPIHPAAALTRLVRDRLPPWEDSLIGAVPGGLGETSRLALIVAGLYLVYRGAIRWETPMAALSATLLAAAIAPIRDGATGLFVWFPGWILEGVAPVGLLYMLHHLTSGGLMLAAVLLAAQPQARRATAAGAVWFGLAYGATAVALRLYSPLGAEDYWAMLLVQSAAQLTRRTPANTSRPQSRG